MSGAPAAPRLARASVSAAFLIHAGVYGSWAPRIPAVKAHLGLGDGQLGLALFGLAAGLVVGARLAAWPVARLGSRATLRGSVPLLCASLLGPALAPGLPALMAALVVMGVVNSVVDVSMNAQAVAVERAYGRPIMSGLHGLWSAGGFLGGALGGLAAGVGASPTVHFAVVAAALAAASVPALRAMLPARVEDELARRARERRERAVWSRAVLVLGAIAFCSFIAEGSAADWSAVYLHEHTGAGQGLAAIGFVAFALAMTAGRLVSDRLAVAVGPVALVRGGGLLAASGLALGLAVPEPAPAIAGFALLGAGLAPAVPAAVSAVANAGAGPAGAVVGRVFGLGYVGGTLGPVAIGACATQVGLRAALGIPVVCAVAIAAAAGEIRRGAGGLVGAPARDGVGAIGRESRA